MKTNLQAEHPVVETISARTEMHALHFNVRDLLYNEALDATTGQVPASVNLFTQRRSVSRVGP